VTPAEARRLLRSVAAGRTSVARAVDAVRRLEVEDLGFARVDHHRALRCGFPEVVFGQGKTPAQVVRIAGAILARSGRLLVTRCAPGAADALVRAFPDARREDAARCVTVVREERPRPPVGQVLVVSGGTGDLPVAEEARVTAEITGSRVGTVYDAGVAGIHRILARTDALRGANCVVVVAGMEGALASVVGGLCEVPVVAVPTSVGYGASFRGLAPLLAMLNSCAAGVAVVNIDNGFGAGFLAGRINRLAVEGGPTRRSANRSRRVAHRGPKGEGGPRPSNRRSPR
jgi:NCAIR mutase (PurE)-related protein